MSIYVLEAKGKKEIKAFLGLPFRLYKRDPLWVPPLVSELLPFLDGRHPFCHHSVIKPFIAFKKGEPVGRVAAIVDHNFISYHGKRVGYFGFFEVVDDLQVTKALFERVEEELKRQYIEEIIGPMNPSTNYECGLLIQGFDTPPFLMMPHNPPYYAKLLEAIGFEKAKDLYANLLKGEGGIPEKVKRIASWAKEKLPEVKIRNVRAKEIEEEVKKFMEVYNESWANNWGFVPMSEQEVSYMAKSLKRILVPELALFAEVYSEPVAFILALPNYNHVLKALGGRMTPWGLVKALLVKRRIKELRIPLFGVRPKYRQKGIDAMLYAEVFKRGWEMGYRTAELSWILEDNHLMQKAIEALGGKPYKVYRIYGKAV